MFRCGFGEDTDICDQPFATLRNLRRHWLPTHVGVQHTCVHCKQTFTRVESLNRHIQGGSCTVLENMSWDYETARNELRDSSTKAQSTDIRRRANISQVELPDVLNQLLQEWQDYEAAPVGDLCRRRRIAVKTIDGYLSHVRKWNQFAFKSSEADVEDDLDLSQFLTMMTKVSTMREFFNMTFVLARDPAAPPSEATIRNYSWAMMRFLDFLKSKVESKSYRIPLEKVERAFSWCQSTAMNHAAAARANHMLRNDLTFLREHNMWLEGHELTQVYDELKDVWEANLVIFDEGDAYVDDDTKRQLQWFAILSLFVLEVPLRSQNILALQLGTSIWFKEDGVYVKQENFKSKSAQNPYVHYKCSAEVDQILRNYLRCIRPLFKPKVTNDMLFCNYTAGTQLSKLGAKMSEFFYQKTGVRGVTPTRIRSIVATAARDLPDNERDDFAVGLLHSPATHRRYYSKVDVVKNHEKARNINRRIFDQFRREKQVVDEPDESIADVDDDDAVEAFADDLYDASEREIQNKSEPEEPVHNFEDAGLDYSAYHFSDDVDDLPTQHQPLTQDFPESANTSFELELDISVPEPSPASKLLPAKRKATPDANEILVDGTPLTIGEHVFLERAKEDLDADDDDDPPIRVVVVKQINGPLDIRVQFLAYCKHRIWDTEANSRVLMPYLVSVQYEDILGLASGSLENYGWDWGNNPFVLN